METSYAVKPFKVLLTGATGFIGRNLTLRMANMGCTVYCITRQETLIQKNSDGHGVHWHFHDGTTLGMIAILSQTKPDLVIHLASLFLSQHTYQNLCELTDSNVLFGMQLLEAMDSCGVRLLLNVGTSWQNYQNDPYSPVNLYAATKQAFEDIALFYCQARKMSMLTLRLFDTYGPDDTRAKLLPSLKRAMRTGERLELSPGEQLIDLVYIDDVIDCFVRACQRLMQGLAKPTEVFALCSGNPISLKELVSLYVYVAKKTLNVEWGARLYRDREVMVPWNTGTVLPGWKPNMELSLGLKHFDDY